MCLYFLEDQFFLLFKNNSRNVALGLFSVALDRLCGHCGCWRQTVSLSSVARVWTDKYLEPSTVSYWRQLLCQLAAATLSIHQSVPGSMANSHTAQKFPYLLRPKILLCPSLSALRVQCQQLNKLCDNTWPKIIQILIKFFLTKFVRQKSIFSNFFC